MNQTFARRVSAGLALAAMLVAVQPAQAGNQRSKDRDVFNPWEKPKPPAPKPKPVAAPLEIPAPPLAERIKTCETGNETFGRAAASTPCPYILDEVKVTGVFDGAEGPGAFVEVKASGQTFFVKQGDKLFDAVVMEVKEAAGNKGAEVVFQRTRHERFKGVTREVKSTVAMPVSA